MKAAILEIKHIEADPSKALSPPGYHQGDAAETSLIRPTTPQPDSPASASGICRSCLTEASVKVLVLGSSEDKIIRCRWGRF